MDRAVFQEYWNKINNELFLRPDSRGRTDFLPDIAYRGLPKDCALLTTLQRLQLRVNRKDYTPFDTDDERAKELARRERRLIDSFRKYSRSMLQFGTTDWDVMLVAQHHRLPTRLLDWTLSPMVAMFFATEKIGKEDEDEPDGVIWCVSRSRTNEFLAGRLAQILKKAKTQQFDLEMLNEHFPRVEEFDEVDDPNALIWFEPPSVDQRIVNQFAYFSMMPGVMMRTDVWLNDHNCTWWKVNVRGDMKAEIRKRLYLINVTDRTLFPGLEGVARWQKAYYSDSV
ncbi:MAG: FRG domain-containing protein [Chloroflexi bacterium]|nr:FRG domain-containing protein [Chloroflexota bacterium]